MNLLIEDLSTEDSKNALDVMGAQSWYDDLRLLKSPSSKRSVTNYHSSRNLSQDSPDMDPRVLARHAREVSIERCRNSFPI